MSRTAIKHELGVLGVSLCMLLLGAAGDQTQTLTFEQRVAAERAILAVYHSHQVGSNKSLDEVASREILERRVRTYLKQSVALESIWDTPVTPAMLEAESARIAREGRLPERLREIYGALGNDPILILECFVRPSLVGRLTRNFFAFDQRFQKTAHDEAQLLRDQLERGEIDPWQEHSARVVVDTGIESTVETRDEFTVDVSLPGSDATGRIARYRVPKQSWDQWWAGSADKFDERQVRPILRAQASLTAPGGAPDLFDPSCARDDTWDNGSLATPTEWRAGPAVWTGSLVLFWSNSESVLRYDPLTDTWTRSTASNYPSYRSRHTAMWAGNVMIVWGGDDGVYFNTGGRYDPVADTWLPTSTVNAPSPRTGHTAIWTGTRMIVWGGGHAVAGHFDLLMDGGQYDPMTDTWTPTSTQNAPSPRGGHTAVWTGSRMIVFGGGDYTGPLRTGGRYDPVSDSWAPTSTVGSVTRGAHSAIWTGNQMVVWGGFAEDANYEPSSTGARYDPVSDTWRPSSILNAPEGRQGHEAIWTGRVMIVWGGGSEGPELGSGGRYDPENDTWLPITPLNAPEARQDHGMVWTGALMIVFGGSTEFSSRLARRGARYDPDTDTWTAMLSTSNAPSARGTHTLIWTGNQMLLWGGCDAGYPLASGGRYDPVTDSWIQTSMTDAPLGRCYHTAVWTGDRMLVWGGVRFLQGFTGVLGTGGRYDPISDTWEPMSDTSTPDARARHTAIWTGNSMIVWGGSADPRLGSSLMLNSGGRYNPATDTWEPTSLVDAPAGRVSHTAVWADTQMVIWGGDASSFVPLGSGGRYDPLADLWRPVSMNGAPAPRLDHTAVWTGDRMVVWGGRVSSRSVLGTGGRYDPVADTWAETTLTGAPIPRWFHASVWTGKNMLIWGGGISGLQAYNTGGRYDPVADTWAATSTAGAPSLGGSPAVWTGDMMITIIDPGVAGGRYFLAESPDADGDGFTICAGDCDDSDAMVNPGAVELPGNLRDEDCDGVLQCNPGADWKNHGQFVRCVALECRQLVESGVVTPQECAALVSGAAHLNKATKR